LSGLKDLSANVKVDSLFFLLNQLSEAALYCFFLHDVKTLHVLRIYAKIFVINGGSKESKRLIAGK
jgi:hypothetical protein